MMENVLVGADIMPAATHLTTSVLSSVHPQEEFHDTNIITMKYGEDKNESGNMDIFIGSLELFNDEGGFQSILDTRQDFLRGSGKHHEKFVELPHGTFDMVIMNPPFTRSTNHGGQNKDALNPAFAGFKTKKDQQTKMSKKLKRLRPDSMAADENAGLATSFLDLANVKLKADGILAFVIPATFASGEGWANARKIVERNYRDVVVVSIADPEAIEGMTAFSADTRINEVLVIGTRKNQDDRNLTPITYVNLPRRPISNLEAACFAKVIEKKRSSATIDGISLRLGTDRTQTVGLCIQSREGFSDVIGNMGIVCIKDIEVSKMAARMAMGRLYVPRFGDVDVPIVKLGDLGQRGLVDRDINESKKSKKGICRGPFNLVELNEGDIPTYPILWSHKARADQSGKESTIVVQPDHDGEVRPGHDEKALERWRHSGRLCFNRDFSFGSQRLSACMTPVPVLGGRGWPNFNCDDPRHAIPIALWMNTTLGLISYWCTGTRQQPKRSIMTVTMIPQIAVLDVRTLSDRQLRVANAIFEKFSNLELRPGREANNDNTRMALDRAVLFDLLGQPEEIMESVDLLREKWCAEPTVRGFKNKGRSRSSRNKGDGELE